ncbi:tyrosine-type recombinase/integrase [Noviherbaspirillum sp. CPCC 100848]|uniref:Tyrosine-type recombinase/integrase n=1 Tax=Noviherbaspirillum album TaxID=3080276 RepID=A0ABU6JGI5_9BURK|nr:tyrosine-type recombinase/integrase [Noviherbaspirillum sp. CPCC 100848]MEC4722776.1 tyrosine-type recombinase/integrase [Noviherbaspirillum sp. CPCC 100848]
MNLVLKPEMLADLMLAKPEPDHALGPVVDDWQAAEVVLRAVREKSRSTTGQTEATYRFHLVKLRWYCENVARVTPSRWSAQDVDRFAVFLADLPADALALPGTKEGQGGWTPFKAPPSRSSQADIKRFVHALFNAWHRMGYIRINPMGLVGTTNARKVNAQRAISLDLYDLVLRGIESVPKTTFTERQRAVRDRFIFEALRGLGLRSSELVHAKMAAFYQVTIPKTGKRYWVFHVTPETGKGGKERRVPVPKSVWDAFGVYRRAFGLPECPTAGENTRLLLSSRTNPVPMRDTEIRRTQDRRFFKAWREITTRQGVYTIVKDRLSATAELLEASGEQFAAEQLRAASPHWLRHTFGKASLLAGQNVRTVASALGHASLETTMIYTEQDALDLIDAVERSATGTLAGEGGFAVQEPTNVG